MSYKTATGADHSTHSRGGWAVPLEEGRKEAAGGRLGGVGRSCLWWVAIGRLAEGLPKKETIYSQLGFFKKKFTAFMMRLVHAFNDITVFDYVH